MADSRRRQRCEECEDGYERQLDPVTGLFFHDIGGNHRQYPVCANQERSHDE